MVARRSQHTGSKPSAWWLEPRALLPSPLPPFVRVLRHSVVEPARSHCTREIKNTVFGDDSTFYREACTALDLFPLYVSVCTIQFLKGGGYLD